MTHEEHKLNEAIKQDGIKTQTEILEELKRRYPQYVEQSDSDKEIEKISEALYGLSIDTKIDCLYVADFLVRQGIGDKKQAVKEFKSMSAQIIAEAFVNNQHNLLDMITEMGDRIDELFTELYGAEE